MISTLEMRIVGLGKLNAQVKIKQLPSIEADISVDVRLFPNSNFSWSWWQYPKIITINLVKISLSTPVSLGAMTTTNT